MILASTIGSFIGKNYDLIILFVFIFMCEMNIYLASKYFIICVVIWSKLLSDLIWTYCCN
jgi:hypothetical protein